MENNFGEGIAGELKRMHKRAVEVLGEYYDEGRIDGATAFKSEKEWSEIMDNLERALKELDERYDDSDTNKQKHRRAIISSVLNSLDIENNLTDPGEE